MTATVTATSTASANLLFLALAPGTLDVIGCVENWRGLRVLWEERQSLPEATAAAARITEIAQRHALHPEARAVLLVPPGIGGILTRPGDCRAFRDPVWRQRQLELALPYAAADLLFDAHHIGNEVRFFWLPKDWVVAQKNALRKFGLRLEAVCPRELLNESTAESAPSAAPVWQEALPVLWQRGELSIEPDLRPSARWRPFLRAATALLALAAIPLGVLSWKIAATEESIAAQAREKRQMAQKLKRYEELDRVLREEGAAVAAVGKLDAAPTFLTLLARFTQALPKEAWIGQMVFDGQSIVVSGKGISDADLMNRLQDAPFEAILMRQEPVADSDDFRLRIIGKPPAPPANTTSPISSTHGSVTHGTSWSARKGVHVEEGRSS